MSRRVQGRDHDGLGYYAVRLLDYTLPEEIPQDALRQPAGLQITGLDTVDQWSVGFLRDGIFHAYASAARRKQTPALPETLELPLLRGTVAVSVVGCAGQPHAVGGRPALT